MVLKLSLPLVQCSRRSVQSQWYMPTRYSEYDRSVLQDIFGGRSMRTCLIYSGTRGVYFTLWRLLISRHEDPAHHQQNQKGPPRRHIRFPVGYVNFAVGIWELESKSVNPDSSLASETFCLRTAAWILNAFHINLCDIWYEWYPHELCGLDIIQYICILVQFIFSFF